MAKFLMKSTLTPYVCVTVLLEALCTTSREFKEILTDGPYVISLFGDK
jgi:hypothetical protein